MKIVADLPISGHDIEKFAQLWLQAVGNPRVLLERAFQPTDDALSQGIEFFFAMIAISTVLSVAGGLTQQGSAGQKLGGTVNGVLGLFYGAICAVTAYFPFIWLGGKATLPGTYLAYCYSAGPYVPLIAFAGLIMLSGFPAQLRAYAINPATANIAFANAQQDPQTSNVNLFLGAFLLWALVIWSNVVLFRSLSFAHDVTGWKLFWAILISFILFGIVGKILQQLGTLFLPPPPASTQAGPPAQSGT